MSDAGLSTRFQQYASIFFFFVLAIGGLFFFGYNAFSLIRELVEESQVIFFNKGSVYFFGGALGLAVMTYWLVRNAVGSPMPESQNHIISYILIGTLILMFVLPHIAHYMIDDYLENKGYQICEEASYQWMYYREIVFTASQEVCAETVAEAERRKSHL